jgi:hypothetical protein
MATDRHEPVDGQPRWKDKKAGVDNPILLNAWNSYPWPAEEGPGEP